MMYRVLSIRENHSVTRSGRPSHYFALDIDFEGKKAKFKVPKIDVRPSDYVELGFDVAENKHGCKLVIAVKRVIPKEEAERQPWPESGAVFGNKKKWRFWKR